MTINQKCQTYVKKTCSYKFNRRGGTVFFLNFDKIDTCAIKLYEDLIWIKFQYFNNVCQINNNSYKFKKITPYLFSMPGIFFFYKKWKDINRNILYHRGSTPSPYKKASSNTGHQKGCNKTRIKKILTHHYGQIKSL